jgi:hypothetical protein
MVTGVGSSRAQVMSAEIAVIRAGSPAGLEPARREAARRRLPVVRLVIALLARLDCAQHLLAGFRVLVGPPSSHGRPNEPPLRLQPVRSTGVGTVLRRAGTG